MHVMLKIDVIRPPARAQVSSEADADEDAGAVDDAPPRTGRPVALLEGRHQTAAAEETRRQG